MKIYTKSGDDGTTSLYGGKRVSKNITRIKAYGDVDELNSYIGLIRSYNKDLNIDKQLHIIQNSLFDLGAELATPPEKMILANGKPRLTCMIKVQQIEQIESWIDVMQEVLPKLKEFILPTGSILTSTTHIARTVCRRAEREVVTLNEIEKVRNICLNYLNRLSDYLFVLARYFGYLDKKNIETPWTPNE
ncbi:cob(I)yrinic acid a,c-diamide adenosyltransferase [Apibacter muscae]|uniref:cob(I)yrinic acid a,c-diamide adenosyltransferase n=1 Tax=Apibacter muscae TaxID=2509004 RepID=UPI0011ACA86A|nr:cob(I)yrinic acid a,c-diamide adenosyltransferase [Apibacter muscae]TWP23881.1 cob(I)yrinic acid a,c-diamide adenosyltransferase [Apibacter muscae]